MSSKELLRTPIQEILGSLWKRLAGIQWNEVFMGTPLEAGRDEGSGPAELPPMVLYVDDDELAILHMKRRLRGQPFVLVTTDDPEKAQELIRTIRFHMVILDVFMPGVSGIELMLDVRRFCDGTPVLMLSGNPPAWLREIEPSGTDACLDKSCSDRELLVQIQRMLAAA